MPPPVYNVVSRDGKHYTVTGDDELAMAMRNGARLEQAEEASDRAAAAGEKARYTGAASYARGLIDRGFSGATAGLSDFVLGSLGNEYDREDLRGRKEQVGTVGQAVEIGTGVGLGLGGAGVLGPGVRSVASATPVGLFSRGAAAITGGQVAGTGVRAGVKRTARVAGGAALEGSANSVGNFLGAVGRGEAELDAESLAAAGFGGGAANTLFAGTLTGVGALATKGRRFIKARDLVDNSPGPTAVTRAGAEADAAVRDSLGTTAEARKAAVAKLERKLIENQDLAAAARARALAKQAKATERADEAWAEVDRGNLTFRRPEAVPTRIDPEVTVRDAAAPENVAADRTDKIIGDEEALRAASDRAAPRAPRGTPAPVDDAALYVPDKAGVTPLLRAAAEIDDESRRIVEALDASYAADQGLSGAHRLVKVADVDPQAARIYQHAIEGATDDMPVRATWRVKGRHLGDPGRKKLGPPLDLGLDELVADTPGRIREALLASNPAERKAILDRLADKDPGRLRDVMRGQHQVFNAAEEGYDRLGAQWRSPLPGTEIQPAEFGARFLPRGASRAPVARPATVPFDLTDAVDDAVPAPLAKGSGKTARETVPGGLLSQQLQPGPGPFADRVRVALDRADDAARFGDRKVFISELARDPVFRGMSLDEVKAALLQADRDGVVALGRADLVGAMDPAKVSASRTVRPIGEGLDAEYHFVEAPPRKPGLLSRQADDVVYAPEAIADDAYARTHGYTPDEIDNITHSARMLDGIGAHEDAGAVLARALGADAPPGAQTLAAARDLALDDRSRRAMRRMAQVAEDGVPTYVPDAEYTLRGQGSPRPPASLARNPSIRDVYGDLVGADPSLARRSGYAAGDLRAALAAEPRIAQRGRLAEFRRNVEESGVGQRAAPMGTQAAPGRGGILSTLADAGAVIEGLQAVGVQTGFDPDKIPVIGPVLGAYLKFRGLMMAGSKLGLRVPRTGQAHMRGQAVRVRKGLYKAVDGLLAGVQKGSRGAALVGATQAWRLKDVLERPISGEAIESAKRKKLASESDLAVERGNEARAAVANPEAVARAVRLRFPADADPDLVDATVAVEQRRNEYLAERAPQQPVGGMFSKSRWSLSLGETVRFARRVRAAQNPRTVFEDIASGSLSAEAADAFRVVYPQLYVATRSYLLEQQAELNATLSPDQVANLSVLFRAPLRPSLDPENMLRLQEAGGYAPAAPAPPGMPGAQAPAPAPNLAPAYDPNAAYRGP